MFILHASKKTLLSNNLVNYRHISGGRFLVSLREVKNSEKFLKISSIVKENINFWEEEIFINNDLKKTVLKIEKGDISNVTDIFETEFSEDSKQVTVYIAG